MDVEPARGGGARRQAVVGLVVALVIGVASVALLGGQVSAILSTVGASVGTPRSAGGGSPAKPEPNGDGQGGGDQSGGSDGAAGDGSGVAGGAPQNAVQLLDIARPELLVIKTGQVTLQVEAIDPALEAATRIIDGVGGYLSASSRSGADAEASAMATFRVPVDAWDRTLVELRGLGLKVLDEQTETEDVTGTVVDLEARVRNLQATEAALQAIMTGATDIPNILRVQDELTVVRGQIEELQSRAGSLRERAAMSTITVFFGLRPVPVVARPEPGFDAGVEADAATAYLIRIGEALTKIGIWLSIVWLPLLVGLSIAGGLGLLVLRRLLRRRIAEPPMVAGAGPA